MCLSVYRIILPVLSGRVSGGVRRCPVPPLVVVGDPGCGKWPLSAARFMYKESLDGVRGGVATTVETVAGCRKCRGLSGQVQREPPAQCSAAALLAPERD